MHVYIPSLSHICIHIRIYKYIHAYCDPVIHLSYSSALSWSASPAFKNGSCEGQSQRLNQWDHHPSASGVVGIWCDFFGQILPWFHNHPEICVEYLEYRNWEIPKGDITLIIYNWKLGMSSIVVIYLHNANVKIWHLKAQEEHDSGLLLYVSHCNVI